MASWKNTRAITNLDGAVDDCDLGTTNPSATLVVYSGTPPTNVDAGLSGNTVLAQLAMSNPAFGNAVDDDPGAISAADAISDDTDADATGTATFARILDRDNTPRLQLSVSATGGGGEVEFNSAAFQENTVVEVTALSVTLPES